MHKWINKVKHQGLQSLVHPDGTHKQQKGAYKLSPWPDAMGSANRIGKTFEAVLMSNVTNIITKLQLSLTKSEAAKSLG